jgi:hypothetical protein
MQPLAITLVVILFIVLANVSYHMGRASVRRDERRYRVAWRYPGGAEWRSAATYTKGEADSLVGLVKSCTQYCWTEEAK